MMIERILGLTEAEGGEELCLKGFKDGLLAIKNLRLISLTPLAGLLDHLTECAVSSPSPDAALNNIESIIKDIPEGLLERTATPAVVEQIARIAGSSAFLSSIIARNPEYYKWLFAEGGLSEVKDAGIFKKELRKAASGLDTQEAVSRVLRLYKQKEYLRIGSRDLLMLADVVEVTRELSDLASASLDTACDFSIENLKKAHGAPMYKDEKGLCKEAVFTVIGLGKLGGRELNFSSDIDILYIYSSDDGETAGVDGKDGSSISLHAFFVKVSQMVTRLISGVTEDGFVFRVDLDLRPEGRSGNMASSLESAEAYYESWGAPWERAALIKARPVAGSVELGDSFIETVRPFVYRRYIDFSAIEEIKSMKEKIDLSLLRRSPDTIDVKLGPGGIREVEFFCQALQLIHGGKNAEIRERHTLTALEKLRAKGLVKADEASRLADGYIFLRNLEHRIQIVEGRQSQAIPAKEAELERLARMMGFSDSPGTPDSSEKKAARFFWEEYREKTSAIHDIYRSLFYKSEDEAGTVSDDVMVLFSPDMTGDDAAERLKGLGFREPAGAWASLNHIRTGPSFMRLGSKTQMLLQRLSPVFLEAAAKSPDPDRTLTYIERFISSVGARTAFYSLLAENPRVIDELVKLFSTSVFLSNILLERPEGLDMLLSKELAISYRTRTGMFDEVFGAVKGHADYEERLDALRRVRNQEIFRIGTNDILGALPCRLICAQITFLAEACLEAALSLANEELFARFGAPQGGRFSILGLGKLGARELTYGSDLDIIFVYDDPDEGSTSGPRVISNAEYYIKLGQRVISILTLRTKEGTVFSVDARLRPSGSAGPLVVSRPAFTNYHRGSTQVWERQAFIKARPSAGDASLGRDVIEELAEIVYSKPLTPVDVDEMLRIRSRMEVEIAREGSDRYNIKSGKGAVIDIEFLTQALQLSAGADRRFRTPYTPKALKRLCAGGLISPGDYLFLKEAYSFYRLIEQRLRVIHDRPEGNIYHGSEELSTLATLSGYTGDGGDERLWAECTGYREKTRELYVKILEGLKKNAQRQ